MKAACSSPQAINLIGILYVQYLGIGYNLPTGDTPRPSYPDISKPHEKISV